jgi:hypothetical protein
MWVSRLMTKVLATCVLAILWVSISLLAQPMPTRAPATYSPEGLDRIIGRIALYTDPLLAQTLAASTFPEQIPDAAHWADEHHNVSGDKLVSAIEGAHLSWDPSVQALLPIPYVLDMMTSDMKWTEDLGTAVLTQRPELLDAVQRMRRKAKDYGYLRPNAQIVVSDGQYIEIKSTTPSLAVPAYDPLTVFAARRPGAAASVDPISFQSGVAIGSSLAPWGWGTSWIAWDKHAVIINRTPWNRTLANHTTYVHPYPGLNRQKSKDQAQPQEFHTDPLDE